MTDQDSIMHGGATINYEVRRSTRRKKTIEVKVSLEGGARLRAMGYPG